MNQLLEISSSSISDPWSGCTWDWVLQFEFLQSSFEESLKSFFFLGKGFMACSRGIKHLFMTSNRLSDLLTSISLLWPRFFISLLIFCVCVLVLVTLSRGIGWRIWTRKSFWIEVMGWQEITLEAVLYERMWACVFLLLRAPPWQDQYANCTRSCSG